MSSKWTLDKGVNDVRAYPRCGRFVTVAVPLALVALTATWLFLGASPTRTAILWGSLSLLAASLVIWTVAVLRDGDRSRGVSYGWALQTASVAPGHGSETVPLRMSGTYWLAIRYGAAVVTSFTLMALWVTLAASDARGTGTSAVLAREGAVIEQRPIVKIDDQDTGSSPRSSATADYTVLLPSPTGGSSVPATFRADTNRRQGIGSELYVASVPGRPELGAIGDDRLAEVERQLDGRAVEIGSVWVIAPLWLLATLAATLGWCLTECARRPARSVTPDWRTLRVTVTGTEQHIEAPLPGDPEAADENKRRKNTRRLQCLVLECRGQKIPFHSQMGVDAAGAVLSGTQGRLLWHPGQRRGRDVLAELVGDDGWQLPGAVPVRVAEQAMAEGLTEPAQPDPERRVRLLDLGAGWMVTGSLPVVVGFLVAFGCLATLLLVPDSGAWRWWTAVAGVLAPAVGFAMQGLTRMAPEGVTQQLQGSR
ncbi:hypothetical protein M2164_002555 [Streptomyces sp. SAI-208]|uniref:hypothetical protein n=1 Tax=Streptomyces sp. SAI-208 TaxID=2940550 RepID=UPI002475BFEA|nr:hypothetical protein [Streptomyces sp. SAI-208]MDH6606920.1 hypothetical protein [Streptomyces sp. SAI-208]